MASLAIPLEHNEMLRQQKNPEPSGTKHNNENRTPYQEIIHNRLETEYKCAVSSVSLARYFCEHFDSLSLAAQSRILDTHDFLILMVPLIEEPPWTRRSQVVKDQSSSWEKFINNQWTPTAPEDLLQITPCDAQPWLAIFHLTSKPSCRESYPLNSHRKSQLLRLRRYMNDVLLDQIPVLADVRRYMDELSLMDVPSSSGMGGGNKGLLMQQVALIREELRMRIKTDWKSVVEEQYGEIFSKIKDSTDMDLRFISELYDMDGVVDALGGNHPIHHKPKTAPIKESPTSKPVKNVIITFFLDGKKVGTGQSVTKTPYMKIQLESSTNSTIVQTPFGPFRRTKFLPSEDNNSDFLSQVPSSAAVAAEITFEDPSSSTSTASRLLECKDLNLPTLKADGNNQEATTSDSLPKREWRQLGQLQDTNLVLQIGFKHMVGSGYYIVDQAFLSQPAGSL